MLDTFIRMSFSRFVQLSGNLIKTLLYVHFKLLPSARFTLPVYARPLLRKTSARSIPRIIWQTNYSNRVTLPVYLNYLWNRVLSATHEYHFHDDKACDRFIRKNFSPEIVEAWSKLQIGAAKADFWRILVLSHHGGIYMDIDSALCWSAESIFKMDQQELLLRNPDKSLTNFFMASSPAHPMLDAMVKQILKNIQENKLTSVYELTGPTVVDTVARDYDICSARTRLVCRQGQFTSKLFQYPDNLKGYWVNEQKRTKIIK